MPMDIVKKLTEAENTAAKNEAMAREAADEALKKSHEEAAQIVAKAKEEADRLLVNAKKKAEEEAKVLKADYDKRFKKEADALASKMKDAKDKVAKIILKELV